MSQRVKKLKGTFKMEGMTSSQNVITSIKKNDGFQTTSHTLIFTIKGTQATQSNISENKLPKGHCIT